jgi:hypothetical protein
MRPLVVAATFIAAGFGPVTAYAGQWLSDPGSACSVWDPLPVPDETIGWSGDCKDGKASGPGKLEIFRAGTLVERNEGAFVDGKQTGPGFRRNRSGRYEGTFKDGLFDGKGVYAAASGMHYDGEWRNGNLDGHGTMSFASGLKYEGHFRANTYNGFGRMIFPDGSRYDGEYLLSTPHGAGVYKKADGAIYAGQWRHGCFSDGNRTAHIGVFAEDCGVSEDAPVAQAPSADGRNSVEN